MPNCKVPEPPGDPSCHPGVTNTGAEFYTRTSGAADRHRKAKQLARRTDLLDKKTAFLNAFARLGSVIEAATAATVDRASHYDWLKSDKDYPARFAEAKAVAQQKFSDGEIQRRPKNQKPIQHGTVSAYKKRKCRCPLCRDGYSAHSRERYARRKLRDAEAAQPDV